MNTAMKPAISLLDRQTYQHPIPNRDYILNILKKSPTALSRKQLANLLNLSASEEVHALKLRLRAMEREGQVAFNGRQGYSALQENELISGRVTGHPDGFGFLIRDNTDSTKSDDLLLSQKDMLQLFDGDRIQVRLNGSDQRGRDKAALVRVVERNTSQLVGRLKKDNDSFYVEPENSRNSHDIDLDESQLNGAKIGQYVVVKITDYPCHRYNAYGVVTEILGDPQTPGIESDIVMRKHNIPNQWPDSVTKILHSLDDEVTEQDKLHRHDLRRLPFITVDGQDAKDFDDAVYCEKQRDGWRLWVAIADVSHYVQPDCPLDQEAQKRGTSVYFPGKVVPMLPEKLSNGLCSLLPNVDRLAMVCEMDINAAGVMESYTFCEAVIRSHARLTYDQVNFIQSEPNSVQGKKLRRQYQALTPHICSLYQLYGALKQTREKRSSIDFDTQEVTFHFNTKGKVDGILPIIRHDAHKMIEECMLCANVATARFLQKMGMPALFRNHKGPSDKKLTSLREFLSGKQLNLQGGENPSPKDYDRLCREICQRSDAGVIQAMMLRSFSQAEYSAINKGHFGLAYSTYAHFTSPIRRYPDLLTHRAIRSVIRRKESGNFLFSVFKSLTGKSKDPVLRITSSERINPESSYPYDKAEVNLLAAQCSDLSRRADKASRDVDAWLKCDYMKQSVGKSFRGTISTVTGFGLFVELENIKVDGLIHISDLSSDFYRFDSLSQSLVGERSGKSYHLGEKIGVTVKSIDMSQKKIAFTL